MVGGDGASRTACVISSEAVSVAAWPPAGRTPEARISFGVLAMLIDVIGSGSATSEPQATGASSSPDTARSPRPPIHRLSSGRGQFRPPRQRGR